MQGDGAIFRLLLKILWCQAIDRSGGLSALQGIYDDNSLRPRDQRQEIAACSRPVDDLHVRGKLVSGQRPDHMNPHTLVPQKQIANPEYDLSSHCRSPCNMRR